MNADRSPATYAVEEAFTIEYRLHAEVRQEFPVEGAGDLECAAKRSWPAERWFLSNAPKQISSGQATLGAFTEGTPTPLDRKGLPATSTFA